MNAPKTTGMRISELRRAEGLTQRNLVALLKQQKGIDVGTSFLSQIESGTKMPSIELAKALADLLSASLDYILMRDDDPSPRPNDLSLIVDAATLEEKRLLKIIVDEVQAVSPSDQQIVVDMVRLIGRAIARRENAQ